MPLPAGTRLGRYDVHALLGAGGMGEVYRATDTSLQRPVAIKVLPQEFAADAGRLRRFQHEALATAALNHPHIVAVYDVGTHDGTAFVVTELLEGRTLREALASGPLPLRKAIDYGAQIASGLAAAHDKNIVHRDLKPDNVFITRDDRVKILDFGIARVVDAALASASASNTMTATVEGTVLGTVGYMSPEQVRGEPVDHRSDIFAFGVVLYEMIAGQRAFKRDSVPSSLAAILNDDPPSWDGDGSALSLRTMRLVQRCLEKSRDARFQSARDLMHVLSDEITDASGRQSVAASGRRTRVSALVGALAALALVGLGGALGYAFRPRAQLSATSGATTTFKISLPPGWDLLGQAPAISRDGRHIAYCLRRGDESQVHVLSLDTGEWKALPDTKQAKSLFFSPDGRQLGLVSEADSRLMRVDVDGGRAPVEVIRSKQQIRGATWTDDDRIVFGVLRRGLFRVNAGGGAPEQLTTPDPRPEEQESDHRLPLVIPGTDLALFTLQRQNVSGAIAVTRMGSGTHDILIEDGANPQFVDGHIVFVNRAGELRAVRFDLASRAVTGSQLALRERPGGGGSTLETAFRAAANGTAIYQPLVAARRRLASLTRAGVITPIAAPVNNYHTPRVSPDGHRIALTVGESLNDANLFIYDIAAGTIRRLTNDGNSRMPQWAGDRRLVYNVRQDGGYLDIIDIDSDNRPSGAPRHVISGELAFPTQAIGDTLLFGRGDNGETDQWELSLAKPEPQRPLTQGPNNQFAGALSRDHHWYAYVSDEVKQGAFEIFLSSYPPGAAIKVATGRGPVWSRNTDELFFSQGTALFAQRVGPKGRIGAPEKLPLPPVLPGDPGLPYYDVFPDGTFVILVEEPEPPGLRMPIVVVNWAAQLRTAK